MGGEIPKQFLPIGGVPILVRCVRAFLAVGGGDCLVVVVVPREWQEHWGRLIRDYGIEGHCLTATGGGDRFHSVRNGLALLPPDKEGEDSLVAIHDGVRPFASGELIERCYLTAEARGTAIPVVPVVDTLRHTLPSGGTEVVDRGEYRLVQTPQVFLASLLRKAYAQPYAPRFTDDASVVESLGIGLTLVEGERDNIKITTPSDLALAEFRCSQ